jgi:hypothetical protein
MSDQEEDDYMSLKFLEEAQEFESKRKEASYTERRRKQLREQEKKGYIKPRAQLEAEEREKGLQKSLEQDNKGMKMLMKMGFKKGMALGSGDGIVEPIKIDLKSGRLGIGMAKKRQRELEQAEEEEARKRVQIDPEDYRAVMAQRAKDQQYSKYVNAAVSVCEKLDEDHGVKSNILWTLRPIIVENTKEDEAQATNEVEEEKEKEEKEPLYPQEEVDKLQSLKLDQQLEALITYLRETYFYCFWCRAKYDSKDDLDANCPGTEEDDH